MAENYAALSMNKDAIDIIQKGIESGFNNIYEYPFPYPYLAGSFFYNSLHDDPRFQKILEKQKKVYEERLRKYGDLWFQKSP